MQKFQLNKSSWPIHATQSIVAVENGVVRQAKTIGGYTSRSGLTSVPKWIEVGSVQAYREDSIPLSDLPEQGKVGVFDWDGRLGLVDIEQLREAVAVWTAWREFGASNLALLDDSVRHIARRLTRRYGPHTRITNGEMEHLCTIGKDPAMWEHEPDADGDVLTVVDTGAGYACYQWSGVDGWHILSLDSEQSIDRECVIGADSDAQYQWEARVNHETGRVQWRMTAESPSGSMTWEWFDYHTTSSIDVFYATEPLAEAV